MASSQVRQATGVPDTKAASGRHAERRCRRGDLHRGSPHSFGWVATYGQVATMAGMPRRARLVGRVLQRLDSATNVPWHRVVNAKGEVSFSLSRNGGDILQRRPLEKEGIERLGNARHADRQVEVETLR